LPLTKSNVSFYKKRKIKKPASLRAKNNLKQGTHLFSKEKY
jgi:hypothetical protein